MNVLACIVIFCLNLCVPWYMPLASYLINFISNLIVMCRNFIRNYCNMRRGIDADTCNNIIHLINRKIMCQNF